LRGIEDDTVYMARRPTKVFLLFVCARLPWQHYSIYCVLSAVCYRPSM